MAQVTQRIWKSGRRRAKHVGWGFTVQRDGKQVRRFREDWTKDDAERAFSEWTLGVETPAAPPTPTLGMAFGQMVEKFLAEKRAERSARSKTTRSAAFRCWHFSGRTSR
jgi:hypothetical protein